LARVSQIDLIDQLVKREGTIALLGGIDTGKTSFGLALAEAARQAGVKTSYIDTDLGQSTVGPPTCVGLKFCEGPAAVDVSTVAAADEIGFVGSISPERHLLPLVTATARMVAKARQAGCRLVIVDTSGLISGIYAELLKFYKLELIRPDSVVGFQRGEELEPVLGVVSRFFTTEVTALKVETAVVERSVEERLAHTQERLRSYFQPPLVRWRIKTTVFMPSVPPGVDLSRLDGLVVGLEDGTGTCMGIGFLEYDRTEDVLRMVTPATEGARGLRLGAVRINAEGKTLGRVSLRELFLSEVS
jgi:polynucleotide 5'-kinase involved in rRNA processing